MKHSLLWIISFLFFAFINSECSRFSRFDIAISFSNSTTKLSTSVFNLSVSNYCVDGLPNAFEYRTVYQGTLVRLKWHAMPSEKNGVDRGCYLSRPVDPHYFSWIAVIIENEFVQAGCSLYTLSNRTSALTNASAILFLHDVVSSFNSPVTKAPFPKSSLLVSSFFRRQNRGGNGLASASPLLISLPMDMFPDLPTQLAMASASSHVAVTGDIELFAESPSTPAIASTVAENTSDLSSSLLLLLIVCVLFLLLGILLVPARLGMCFWQRFCFLSLAGSAKTRRSRKLTAATEKALKQLPVKCLNQVDPLISDQCAICIEIFKPHDLIRSLPCRHMYHRACIDPWLLKHRSCPLCKQNILIACGLPMADEDINSCSASSTDVNSAFSVSTASSTSSFSTSLEGLLSLFSCHHCCRHLHFHHHHYRRRNRYPRHHHHNPFHRGLQHVPRPGSSLYEISSPSGDRRVLGSASENSSSSINTRSVPSDLFRGSTMTSSALNKSSRFAADEFGEEESQSVERSLWRRRQRSLVSYCACCKGGIVRLNKEVPVERFPPPPPPLPATCGIIRPTTAMCPPSVAHPSTMFFYHLPQSMAFTQIPTATSANLPSYEQATASMPIFPPCSRQEVAGWNPPRQQVATGSLDPSLQHGHLGAKTNVVYTVLSTSAARMSVSIGVPPASVVCSPGTKLPIFVDVNTPGVAETFEGQRQFLLSSSSSPPLIHTQEPPPPAYSLATLATNQKPMGISLNPLRQAARLLTMHLLHPPIHKLHKPHRHHHTSFFGGLKHYRQSKKSKSLLKPLPHRLQETSTPATAPAGVIVNRRRPHPRCRGCQRTGLLAKTLELNHEGVIMPSGSGIASAITARSSPVPSLHPLPLSPALRLSDRASSPRCSSNLVSESSSEGTYNSPLRHTRVCSVRVTVEPQVQCHVERDASSCEALHSRILHDFGSDTSLPTPSTSTDIGFTAAAIVASSLRCRFSDSAPAICLSTPPLTDKISSSSSSSSLPTL